ncbi:hypothetical protein [Microbacterium sp. SORGH_AS_0888]|uniref:hypothetical protein n=1 Tax=Microbacterium sp. SORGH_AS_0888 TaxID=3041791 RepID=UPI002780ECF4|nr:hypothetical protein [Microbacterium sp. SORGH_AS_0888]MDQ1130246.1 hypothetical protein [Microbacterium sp. SORGH_AS_0888]
MTIQQLLDQATEPDQRAAEAVEEAPRSRLSALIACAREQRMESVPFEMAFGETVVEVVLTEVRGFEWCDLTATAPPRPGNTEDVRIGANTDTVLARFPVDRIVIDGEHPTAEEWVQVVALIAAPFRSDIVAALWWIHWGRHVQQLKAATAAKNEKEASDG